MPATVYGSLGELSDAQLQAAVDRFGLGPVQRVWALTDGAFGKNVAVDTTEGAWVLRGDPRPPGTGAQFRKEAFFARAIHERCSVPAPWPYLIEEEAGILPWPYALMPRIEGHGVDVADPELDWTAVAEGLGRGLAALHCLTWPAPGEWKPGPNRIVAFDGTPAEWLEARTAAHLVRFGEVLDGAGADLVLANLELARAVLAGEHRPVTYVHHDYKVGNVSLARGPQGQIDVVGVFDLDEGYAGDPAEDLPRTLWSLSTWHGPAVAGRFLEAYRGASGTPVTADLLLAYTVFDLLVLWEFGRRRDQGWIPPDAPFASWAGASLVRVREAVHLAS